MYGYQRMTFGQPSMGGGAPINPAPTSPFAQQQGFRVAPVGQPPVGGTLTNQPDPRAMIAQSIMNRYQSPNCA